MKKYKVLMVHNYYQIPGGEDTVVENEVKMLQKYGHEIVLYTKNNKDLKTKGLINKVKNFVSLIFSFKAYKEVNQIIKKEKIDIMHVHNTILLISPSVYYAAFKNKIPIVQTLHNFRFLCPGATLTRNGSLCSDCLKKGLRYSVFNKCYRNSYLQTFTLYTMLKVHRFLGTYRRINANIALTEFNKKLFSQYMKQMRNIFVKPNFIFKNEDKHVERQIENYFVYLGRLDEIKGVKNLIQYWSNYKGCKLLIIGSGPEEEYIKNFIEKNNIKNIELIGFLKREEALKILLKAKAMVMPTLWYEGFPMTIVESFSLGVPVIGSKLGNVGSIIEHEKNGLLFEINNEEEFIKAISMIDNDLDYNKQLSDGAYKTFVSKYTDELNYNNLMKVYKAAEDDINGSMQDFKC